ncbi:HAD family hydrolase [Persicobacter psychrovividus]
MKKSICYHSIVCCIFYLLVGCSDDAANRNDLTQTDPLPSWNEGKTKSAIIDFVDRATDPEHQDFIAIEDRIATFDNDGNLWSEQPMYFQLLFTIDRVKAMAGQHPEWKEEQPFKAVLEDDIPTLLSLEHKDLFKLLMATHAGITTTAFNQEVKKWMKFSKHPRFNQPYTELVYQPMLELMQFLRSKDFQVFIVSGGGVDFMRAWVTDVYGIPSYQVVGSSMASKFEESQGRVVINKVAKIDFIDDKEGKPVGIHKFIGKRPVFASGNSDGDLQMMQYTAAGEGSRFMLYLHHTDGKREWAYDRNSSIGKLDKGLDEAKKHNWTVIDMAKDWRVIYPFEQ